MDRTKKTDTLMSRVVCLTAACGLAMGAGVAHAQWDDNTEGDHLEYEPGEGYHEEEWYDPSDWWDDDFDGIRGPDTDYEESDWNVNDWNDDEWDEDEWDEESYAVYDDESYDWDWWDQSYTELYNDGYYDGYTDGYTDDSYGYDIDVWSWDVADSYESGYLSGYYDGFYDQEQEYESDWTYYIYATPADQQRADAQRERGNDRMRERGDRAAEARTEKMSRQEIAEKTREKDRSRVRGIVQRVEKMSRDALPEGMKGNHVVRVTFEDGKRVTADLGPNAERGLISQGDRVTITGKRVERDGRRMLDATRLSVNDEVMWNARDEREPRRMSSR